MKNIQKGIKLKDHTTFRLGGYAEYFAEAENIEQLKEIIEFAGKKKLNITILGGGSNLLFSDTGVKGLVIKYTDQSIEFVDKDEYTVMKIGAGLNWDKAVEKAVEKDLQGIECMSGIPGSTGAAPVQNIGAYGQELKDAFLSLKAYDFIHNKIKIFSKEDCEFSYRDSFFKQTENRGKYLILQVNLRLIKNGNPNLEYQSLKDYLKDKKIAKPALSQVRSAVLEIRGLKLEDPKVIGNAGSFFKNPIIKKIELEKIKKSYPDIPAFELEDGRYKLFAGWLIDKAGWKGKSLGGARVSEKNALVLINPGNASSKDIVNLAKAIQDDVLDKFRINLEPEVNIV